MKFDEVQFFNVISKKLSGQRLSSEEETYIQEMLELYAPAREMYKTFQEAYEDAAFRELLENDNPSKEVDNIIHLANRNRGKHRLKMYSAAACIAVIGLTALYFFFRPKHSRNFEKDAIVLNLSNGESIAIPASRTTLRTEIGTVVADSLSMTVLISDKAYADALATLRVPFGKRYSIVLSDSTVIQMNAGSVVQFPFAFTGNRREVTVQGEAYLKIAPTATKPFIVHTAVCSIEVLGTEFNVNTNDSGTKISLTHGSVRVRTSREQLTIRPGEQAVVSVDHKIGVTGFNEKQELVWLEDEYIFDGTPLGKIMEIMKRQYGVQVVFRSPEAADMRISGIIEKEKTLTQILTYISSVTYLQIFRSNDTVYISKQNRYMDFY